MRHARATSLSLVAALGLSSSLAHAELFSLGADTYDVQFVAGSGPNKALLQLDFNSDGSFLFAYQWTGSATGRDQLLALENAAQGLSFTETPYSFPNPPGPDITGYFLNTLYYNALQPVENYPDSFWWFFTSTDGQTWLESQIGYADVSLTDGSFLAFALQSSDPNYPDYLEYPPIPMNNYPEALEPVTGSAIPEPATVSLLGLSLIALITKRRAQQH